MDEFQRKKKFHRYFYSKLSVVILAILTIFLIRGAVSVIQKERQSKENLEKIEAELILANERQKKLEEDIDTLSTPTGIEGEIRSKYNVKREGEDVIIVVDPETNVKNDSTSVSFWSKIGNWFKKLFE